MRELKPNMSLKMLIGYTILGLKKIVNLVKASRYMPDVKRSSPSVSSLFENVIYTGKKRYKTSAIRCGDINNPVPEHLVSMLLKSMELANNNSANKNSFTARMAEKTKASFETIR